jgi:hypothetical protein
MKKTVLLILGVLATSSAGCATYFNGSAPTTSPQKAYVVGSKANRAQVWLCPTTGGDCQEVEVSD